MSEIRVLIISAITGSASSGPDAGLVLGLRNQGVAVDVMIPPDSPLIKTFEKSGIRVIPWHPVKKFSLKGILRIRREILSRSYDIIHLFNSKAIVNGAFAATGLKVKVIAYRGAAGLYWYDPTAWLAHLHPRIDVIICNSWYVQHQVRKNLLFHKNKAVMIHKGMDMEWFNDNIPVPRSSLGIPDNALVAGCVANVRKVKGVPYLLRATYHLDPELPLHFVFIGFGMQSAAINRLIALSPFRDRIHVLGFRKDVYSLIAACDLYIQPSLSESLSRSVMEAMCLGVPCIVSDVGGLAELVAHEKSGLLAEKANALSIAGAIEKLCRQPDLRMTFSKEGRKRMVEIFSVERLVFHTKELYDHLCS